MHRIYFKQAIEMLKQNKFFSIVSIMGTALAIMMIMAIIVSEEAKNTNAVPEIHRDRTFYISYQIKKDTDNSWASGNVTHDIARKYIPLLETPEYVSAFMQATPLVSLDGSSEMITAKLKGTDPSFWKILSFSFIEGGPFTEEEFESGIRNAVISESMSRKILKNENAMGKIIRINFQPYRIIGIVKDVSEIFDKASADIWVPYTSQKRFSNSGYEVMILTRNTKDITAIREEIRRIEQKFNGDEAPWTLSLRGPETHRINQKKLWGNNDQDMMEMTKTINRKTIFILIIILLVPAINLSGLSLSRIKKRIPEIGLRKAFGAKRHVILTQVLWENLITSFIGGFIGLALSFLVIFQMREWLLGIPSDGEIPFSTLISIPVLLAVVIVCILINILSAAIPAYRASRMSIINSLTNNEKQP